MNLIRATDDVSYEVGLNNMPGPRPQVVKFRRISESCLTLGQRVPTLNQASRRLLLSTSPRSKIL